MRTLTAKEWLIAFVLPLAVGLILWAVSAIPKTQDDKRILYYDLTILNDVSEGKPKKLKQYGEIKIFNFNDKDISNVDLVIPNFTKSNAKFDMGFGIKQPILAEPITATSVDENGVLRIKYKKIFSNSEAAITFTADDDIFVPHEVQSANDEVDLQPIIMVKPTPPAQSWMNIYVALPILQIVVSICLFFVLKASIKNSNKRTQKETNV